MRRTAAVLVAVGLVGLPGRSQAQEVSIDPSAASNEALEVVSQAVATFEQAVASHDCVGPAAVIFERIGGRGEYRTRTATVVINPSRGPASMAYTTVHELAHHAMVSCLLYADQVFTASFYEAQGLPSSRGWFDYRAGWAAAPAEHFADALTMVITGRHDRQIQLSSETIALVRAWLAGGLQGRSSSGLGSTIKEAS